MSDRRSLGVSGRSIACMVVVMLLSACVAGPRAGTTSSQPSALALPSAQSPSDRPFLATNGPASMAPIRSWADFNADLATLAPDVSALAAEIGDGRCGSGSDFKPVNAVDATRPLAIGPSSRAFVLGGLAQQVNDHAATWSDLLAVRDDWKSSPMSTIGQTTAGSEFSLEKYAREMIAADDNSAADHLLHRLGREVVEAYLTKSGVADPSPDVPFLSSREEIILAATGNETLAGAYAAADAAGRRLMLTTKVANTALPTIPSSTIPSRLNEIGWFASATDMCYAMLKLRDFAAEGRGPILDILAARPGLLAEAATWPYVGLIGGTQPGISQSSWLLRRSDQRWFVLTVTLNDPRDALPDAGAALGLAQAALDLLAEAP